MEFKTKRNTKLRHILNFPFIWIQLIPLLLLDISVELYHQTGFRLCGIPLVKRSKYFKIDRHKLEYLSLFEKIACTYCSYANCLLHYDSEIAARTEKYWCGIKHKKTKDFVEPKHHKGFIRYGDKATYKKKIS